MPALLLRESLDALPSDAAVQTRQQAHRPLLYRLNPNIPRLKTCPGFSLTTYAPPVGNVAV